MSKTLYIDASSGISGDMTVGALLDLGADADRLKQVINSLGVPGFHVEISRVQKGAAECCDFDVILDKGYENHDHDMEYLYGHEKERDFVVLTDLTGLDIDGDEYSRNNHDLTDTSGHHHSHVHDELHLQKNSANKYYQKEAFGQDHAHIHDDTQLNGHDHEHNHINERSLSDVIAIIDSCGMSENAKDIAKKTFEIVAAAEAEVHGKSIDEVHFHEVGALDSIADIIAAAFCIDDLGIKEVIITHLTDGQGTVRCRHGIIPVPVPAVDAIVTGHAIPLEICDVKGELVTPTGAAFAAAVRTIGELPASYRILKSGKGSGKRDYPTRGYLEAHIIQVDRLNL